MQKEDEKFVQKLQIRKIGFKKDLPVNPQLQIVFRDGKLRQRSSNVRASTFWAMIG